MGRASDVRSAAAAAVGESAQRARPGGRRIHRHLRPDPHHPRHASAFAANGCAPAVALYITAAYWFTSSTSFANPAITVARSLSDTFAGIAPRDVPLFIVAQLLGAAAAALVAEPLFDRA